MFVVNLFVVHLSLAVLSFAYLSAVHLFVSSRVVSTSFDVVVNLVFVSVVSVGCIALLFLPESFPCAIKVGLSLWCVRLQRIRLQSLRLQSFCLQCVDLCRICSLLICGLQNHGHACHWVVVC